MPAVDRWELASLLYGDYDGWCRASNMKPLSLVQWGREMTKRGIEKKRAAGGNAYALVRANLDHLAATDALAP